jgi:hypothetical protein
MRGNMFTIIGYVSGASSVPVALIGREGSDGRGHTWSD